MFHSLPRDGDSEPQRKSVENELGQLRCTNIYIYMFRHKPHENDALPTPLDSAMTLLPPHFCKVWGGGSKPCALPLRNVLMQAPFALRALGAPCARRSPKPGERKIHLALPPPMNIPRMFVILVTSRLLVANKSWAAPKLAAAAVLSKKTDLRAPTTTGPAFERSHT